MLECPSSSLTVTMSTLSRVSREAKVWRNMCQVIFPREVQIQLVTGVGNPRFNVENRIADGLLVQDFEPLIAGRHSATGHTYALGPFAMWRWKRLRKRMDTALQGHE